jgi:hypothetical protein
MGYAFFTMIYLSGKIKNVYAWGGKISYAFYQRV